MYHCAWSSLNQLFSLSLSSLLFLFHRSFPQEMFGNHAKRSGTWFPIIAKRFILGKRMWGATCTFITRELWKSRQTRFERKIKWKILLQCLNLWLLCNTLPRTINDLINAFESYLVSCSRVSTPALAANASKRFLWSWIVPIIDSCRWVVFASSLVRISSFCSSTWSAVI